METHTIWNRIDQLEKVVLSQAREIDGLKQLLNFTQATVERLYLLNNSHHSAIMASLNGGVQADTAISSLGDQLTEDNRHVPERECGEKRSKQGLVENLPELEQPAQCYVTFHKFDNRISHLIHPAGRTMDLPCCEQVHHPRDKRRISK